MSQEHYIIRGGLEGRERLRVLSRVMQPTTLSLFDRVGIEGPMTCLDIGCGGGDVTLDLARRVSPKGKVVGTDIDETKIHTARSEAQSRGVANVAFRLSDIREQSPGEGFDVVYARFLLTHLKRPDAALKRMHQSLRPGGKIVVEDIDFAGHFCWPDCPPLWRYIDLYTKAVRNRGGDPHIGPRLPSLLSDAGFEAIGMNVVQPAGLERDVKLVNAITMESIADAVLADRLATREEIDHVVAELYEFAQDPKSVASIVRVVQAWGCRPEP